MSAKPTILLVPGSFSTPVVYADVMDDFTSKGYSMTVVSLPTTEKKPGVPPTMYDDAARIAGEAEKLADEGKEIVIVAHSYGGFPSTQSLKGLTKAEREKQGKKGGVVRIAYMTAIVGAEGESNAEVVSGGSGSMDLLGVDEDGWMYQKDPVAIAKIVFNDLSPEVGLEWAKKFVQHSAVSFANPLTHAGYKDVPTSYLFCENDLTVTPEIQQRGIDIIEKASGRKVDVTKINSDHAPPVSARERVVEWFVGLVEKTGE